MIGRRSTALFVAVALAGGVAPAWAGDASGTFVVKGGGTIAPKYAAAFETRDSRNTRVKIVEVVLSEFPISAQDAAEALSPHTQVINQDALSKHDYVLLWVRPDGNVSMNATFGATMLEGLLR